MNDLLLAVNHAPSNCVQHIYCPATVDGTVELTFWTESRSVCIEIVEHEAWRIPCGQSTGRAHGIEIMQRLTPVVLIRDDNRGMWVLLSHPLSGRSPGSPPNRPEVSHSNHRPDVRGQASPKDHPRRRRAGPHAEHRNHPGRAV